MRTSTRLLAGLAAAGAVAAGGSALTAGNTFSAGIDNVAGYGESTVTGATISTIKHNLSTNGQTITSSTLTFSSAVKNTAVVRAGFNGADQVTCTVSASTYTCTYTTSVTTSSASNFTVSVS